MADAQPHHNNVDEHKRVSFGGEDHVRMIEYDDGPIDEEFTTVHATRQNTSFTETDAPPSKVKVHSEQSEVPRPISPPAQIVEVPVSSSSYSHQTIATMAINSPPLPAFMKRKENEVENPFRPDEQLYHEVDPIVEAYRRRPFPPSPSHGSPIPPHQQTTSHQATHTTTAMMTSSATNSVSPQHRFDTSAPTPTSTSTTPKKPSKQVNGGGRSSSLAEARRETELQRNNQQPLLSSDQLDGLPPPNKAEVIHMDEEKRKRACCSLQ